MEELLSLAEAAAELGIAPVTLRAAVARGRLAARLFGQTYVTTRDEVERYRHENLGHVGRPPLADGLSAPAPYVDKSLTKGRVSEDRLPRRR